MVAELEFQQYNFDLKRDRNFSSILFSHLIRINNYPKNKQTISQMQSSKYDCVRNISNFIDYPPIPDAQIESLRGEVIRENKRQKIDQKPPLWSALLTNLITGYLKKSTINNQILEIGTFTGLTSAYIAKRNPNSYIDTLDIDANLVLSANKNFDALGLENVRSHYSDYRKWSLEKYDVIFKDGLHHGQANLDLADYLASLSFKDSRSRLLIFDDIRWSWDMYKAWKTICNRQYANVVIDCFHIGVIIIDLPLVSEGIVDKKEEYRYSLPGILPR